MGSLGRFDLKRIVTEYNTPNFFETGTFLGDGIAYALKAPFAKIISVEIIPEIAVKAGSRFQFEEKVEILNSDSFSAMEHQLPMLTGNTFFWLDAHYPGAGAGLADYASGGDDETLRLPLIKELELICRYRRKYQDVLILDDLRIYEDGPFQNGPVPFDALPRGRRSTDFVYQYFSATHYIFKSFIDEGYILLFPKKMYDRRQFKWSDLFN